MPDDKLTALVDSMIAAGDSDDKIRAVIQQYKAKQAPPINWSDETIKGGKAFGKRLAENLFGMAQMAVSNPQKAAVEMANNVTGAYIREGSKAFTDTAKGLSPIQPGEGSIGERGGRVAADLAMFLMPGGAKKMRAPKIPIKVPPTGGVGGGFGETLMKVPQKLVTPESLIDDAQKMAGPHSLPAPVRPVEKVSSFQRATGMETPSGTIVGAPVGSGGQVSMSVPVRPKAAQATASAAATGTGKVPLIRRPLQTTTEELIEQTQRGVQNNFEKGKRVTFQRPVESPMPEVSKVSTPEQKAAAQAHYAEVEKEAPHIPGREPLLGRLKETLKDETGSVPRRGKGVKLYRVEPKDDLGDQGNWLKKHLTPQQYEKFVSERGRLFTDDLEVAKRFGAGEADRNVFEVTVSEDVAKAAKRAHPEGYTEYLLPADVVAKKTLMGQKAAVPTRTLTHPQKSSVVRGGLEQIQQAYDQAKSIPRAERTAGQQKLYDEIGKLLALSRKAVGQKDVPAGKITNPNEFVEMLRRVSKSEQGAASIKTLIPLAGALVGGALNPEDPVKGGLIGGVGGLGLANLGKVGKGAIALRREGFLTGAAIPKNLAASLGGAATAAVEHGTTAPIKEMLRLPTNLKEFGKAINNPQHKFQFATGAPAKPKGLAKVAPSNIISAIDQTTSKALQRAGIPVEDIERILLTADRNPIAQMINASTKAGSPERATADAIGRVILPFQRTPANVVTEGFGEFAHMRHNPTSARGMVTAASPLIGWAIGEWVKEKPKERGPLGGIALAALGSRSALATLVASATAGRQVLGGVSPMPEMAFEAPIGPDAQGNVVLKSSSGIPPAGIKFWKRVLGKE